MRRGDLSGEDPVRRPQRGLQICHGRLPVPDAQEGCHDASHHLAQERIACHVDRDHATLPADPHPVEGPDRLSVLAAECGEVMPTDQGHRGPVHRRHIEPLPDTQGVPLAEWAPRSVPDGVSVLPSHRSAAWLEPDLHPAQWPDRDIRRQHRPDGPTEHRGRDDPPAPGECDHLSTGVDPGIGPARPIDPDAVPRRRCCGAPSPALPGRSASQVAPGSRRTRSRRIPLVRRTAPGHPLGWIAQTSSSWTMGARSPARRPIFVSRVYPELRSP